MENQSTYIYILQGFFVVSRRGRCVFSLLPSLLNQITWFYQTYRVIVLQTWVFSSSASHILFFGGFRRTETCEFLTGERLLILTYARRLRPLRSEDSFAYHTYCDTAGVSVYKGIIWGPVTLTPIAYSTGAVTTCSAARWRFEHQTFRMHGERSKASAPESHAMIQ